MEERSNRAALVRLAEAAGEAGAMRALERVGLSDTAAGTDVAELRTLLRAWRDAKRSAWKATVAWAVNLVLALVLIGMSVKLGMWR